MHDLHVSCGALGIGHSDNTATPQCRRAAPRCAAAEAVAHYVPIQRSAITLSNEPRLPADGIHFLVAFIKTAKACTLHDTFRKLSIKEHIKLMARKGSVL